MSDIYQELSTITETEFQLNNILSTAFSYPFAVAAWRKPGDSEIHVIVDFSDNSKIPVHPDLENSDPGFLVSPFYNEANFISFLIRPDLHFKGTTSADLSIKDINTVHKNNSSKFLKKLKKSESSEIPAYPVNTKISGVEKDKETFINIVKSGIDLIREKQFIKVVPSRRTNIRLSDTFDLGAAFLKLVDHYPYSFVSLFSIPEMGTWLGASPEIIINIDENGIFTTSAVAGTQQSDPDIKESSVGWTQKEIEEQALVSRYIINCFKKIRLREFEEYGPKTIRAGNLVHLKTDFQVDINSVNFPQLGSVMLKLLHPTSAVCGMPKEPSLSFIRQFEGYDREFYSGYLGPVNIENQTNIYVNLRCAQLLKGKALLYAGAGVTVDSDPEKEWNETVIKNQTMESFLSSTSNGNIY